jgi:hypothetical protein
LNVFGRKAFFFKDGSRNFVAPSACTSRSSVRWAEDVIESLEDFRLSQNRQYVRLDCENEVFVGL